MGELRYIDIREDPQLAEDAAAWFHSKWEVPEEEYLSCITAYLNHENELGWFLCLDDDDVVGGLGVIENDFHDRKDLAPNICAVYTEVSYRGEGIAGRLLDAAVVNLRAEGISPVYLVTELTGFYERYGWEFLCMVQDESGLGLLRMYVHE
ncbi:MAG: GNAT family N-acetyltransferase [Eggerthellaceae bacterium]|nr:GNAT family N-acetyltransferase [Eggerthellaceae bacterium]